MPCYAHTTGSYIMGQSSFAKAGAVDWVVIWPFPYMHKAIQLHCLKKNYNNLLGYATDLIYRQGKSVY